MNEYGTPEPIAIGFRLPEGPGVLPDGSPLLVEIAPGALTRVSADGAVKIVVDLGSGPNGLTIGRDGAAYI